MNKRYFGRITEILCLMIALGTVLCSVPVFATEVTGAEDTVEEVPATVEIVVAAETIRQGDRIGNQHIIVKEVPNINLPDNIIISTEGVVGKFVSQDIYAGEYINSSLVTADTVVKVNEDAVIRPIKKCNSDFVIVTDYVRANTGLEIEYYIQMLIEENPNRTIYFPAGEYVFGSPLSIPADAMYSVSLLLDDGAVIKAADTWRADGELDALICLGGVKAKNDIYSAGSYYSVQGGVLDARDRTDGISVESGRETVVRNICIKNAKTGIDVRKGANNKSSDCDFEDITIIGSNRIGSVGVDIVAYDNTFTTVRIYDMQTGMICKGGGHIKDIQIVNTSPERAYAGTVGFISGGTFLSNCYVENYEIAYANSSGEVWDCTAAWTSDACKKQIAFKHGKPKALTGCKALFRKVEGAEIAFTHSVVGRTPSILGAIFDEGLITNWNFVNNKDSEIVWAK